MALLQKHAMKWFTALFDSLIRVYCLSTLIVFSPVSPADEVEELSVTEADGEYTLRIVSILDAPADYVYDVITDYKHAYRINPSITKVEILPSDHDDVVRMRDVSEHCVGPFCFTINWVGDFLETRKGDIKVTTVPEFSNFESGSAIWKIRSRGQHTWVLHESRLIPDFFIPPVLGSTILKNKMRTETLATFKRIECQAIIMLERDMSSGTELLNELSEEGKDCINQVDMAANMSP